MKRLVESLQESNMPISNRFKDIKLFEDKDILRGFVAGVDIDTISFTAYYNGLSNAIESDKRESLWGYGEIYNPPIRSSLALTQNYGQPVILSHYYPQHEYSFLPMEGYLFKNSQFVLGDWGFSNVNGYFIGLLNGGPGLLMANPMSSIEVYDINSEVQIHSFNFYHETGISTEEVVVSEEKINNGKQLGNKKETYQDILDIYTGCIGGVYTRLINKLFYEKLFEDGKHITTSSKDIILSTGTPIEITGVKDIYDPTNASIPEKSINFEWGKGPRICNEEKFQKHISNQLTESFTSKEGYTPKSWIHEREDGSIILMSKSGSAIELTSDGDIIISPARDLKIQPARNTTVISGGFNSLISKEETFIKSTNSNLSLLAKENIFEESNKKQEKISEFTSEYDIINQSTKTVKNEVTYKQNISCGNLQISSNQTVLRGGDWINRNNQSYFSGNQLLIEEQDAICTKSNVLGWYGSKFVFDAQQTGIITGGSNIDIKHEHRASKNGSDIFTYVSCGKDSPDCKVVLITKDVPRNSIPVPPMPSHKIQKISFDIQTRNYPNNNEVFSLMPWSNKVTNSFTNISEDFPTKNTLLDSNGNPINWDNYKIL